MKKSNTRTTLSSFDGMAHDMLWYIWSYIISQHPYILPVTLLVFICKPPKNIPCFLSLYFHLTPLSKSKHMINKIKDMEPYTTSSLAFKLKYATQYSKLIRASQPPSTLHIYHAIILSRTPCSRHSSTNRSCWGTRGSSTRGWRTGARCPWCWTAPTTLSSAASWMGKLCHLYIHECKKKINK